jgi:hypothetical protein
MKKDLVDLNAAYWGESRKAEIRKIAEFLENDLSETGTRVYLEDEEIYCKKITFQTDGDTIDRKYLESEGKTLDFGSISNEELLSYIYGEYIIKGVLGMIEGFGSTQVKTY